MCWEHGAARRKPNVKLRSAEVTTNKSLDVCHLEWVDPDFDKKLGLPCGRRLLSNCFQLTELFYTALFRETKNTSLCLQDTDLLCPNTQGLVGTDAFLDGRMGICHIIYALTRQLCGQYPAQYKGHRLLWGIHSWTDPCQCLWENAQPIQMTLCCPEIALQR